MRGPNPERWTYQAVCQNYCLPLSVLRACKSTWRALEAQLTCWSAQTNLYQWKSQMGIWTATSIETLPLTHYTAHLFRCPWKVNPVFKDATFQKQQACLPNTHNNSFTFKEKLPSKTRRTLPISSLKMTSSPMGSPLPPPLLITRLFPFGTPPFVSAIVMQTVTLNNEPFIYLNVPKMDSLVRTAYCMYRVGCITYCMYLSELLFQSHYLHIMPICSLVSMKWHLLDLSFSLLSMSASNVTVNGTTHHVNGINSRCSCDVWMWKGLNTL